MYLSPRYASPDSVDKAVLPILIFKSDLAGTAATLLSARDVPV